MPENSHTQADEARWLRAAQHDPTQFEPLYRRYVDRIYAYCKYRVGAHDAEDVASQVFTKALVGASGYQGGSVRAWLFRIAHNCVIDHVRACRSRVSLDEMDLLLIAADPDPLDRVAQDQMLAVLRELIAQLPEDRLHLLTLKLVSGMNATEIGKVVGKRPGAVRVELHRIFNQLRQQYQQIVSEEVDR